MGGGFQFHFLTRGPTAVIDQSGSTGRADLPHWGRNNDNKKKKKSKKGKNKQLARPIFTIERKTQETTQCKTRGTAFLLLLSGPEDV